MLQIIIATALVIVIISNVVTAVDNGTLHLLTDYPEAKCLDGTPGGMYVHYPNNKRSRKIIFHMEGGGLCPTLDACYMRADMDLGSSKSWTKTDGPQHGFLSGNCTQNPLFCDFIRIRLNYCDGNLYSSAREDPISHALPHHANKSLWFRGAQIRHAALHYVVKHFLAPLKAEELIISGGSAGAISAFIHASDMIADVKALLGPESSSLVKVGAIPLSGFFPGNVVTVDGLPLIKEVVKSMLSFCNCTASRACLAWAEREGVNPQVCMSAAYGYRFSDVPYFAMQSSSDAWQIPCELLAGPGTEGPGTEKCRGAKGYAGTSCPSDEHPSFANCTQVQVAPLIKYQNWYRNLTVFNTSKNSGFTYSRNGVFLISCYKHVAGLSTHYWTKTSIRGVTMPIAAGKWWASLSEKESVRGDNDAHTYIDCARTMEMSGTGYECNPTCNPDDGSSEKEEDQHSIVAIRKKYGDGIGMVF